MNRIDCINHLRAGRPMTHRVSRIIADILDADGVVQACAEDSQLDSHLLRTLADIREAMGVGAKPMLDELPGLVLAMKDERGELARAVASWGAHHCECPKFKNWSDGQESLPHLPGCPVGLAERITKDGA